MFWVTRSWAVAPPCQSLCMNGNDAWSAVAELAASQHGVFHRSQAASFNINAQHLRRAVHGGRLRLRIPDVFAFPSTPDSWLQRHMAVSLVGGIASHRSAAALHQLDGFRQIGPRTEVCFARNKERRIQNVTIHRWRYTDVNDITAVDGIRCLSVARTLFQLGAVCTPDQVEAALDSALRSGAPLRWISDTADRLQRPGPTGGNVLRKILQDPRRSGALSESLLERIIERVVADNRLPAVVRQHPVHLSSGWRRLDLAFPDVRLGIEGHSRRHHFGRSPVEADHDRDLELAAAGWEVLYVTWKMAHEPEALVDRIVAIYQKRASQLSRRHSQLGG